MQQVQSAFDFMQVRLTTQKRSTFASAAWKLNPSGTPIELASQPTPAATAGDFGK